MHGLLTGGHKTWAGAVHLGGVIGGGLWEIEGDVLCFAGGRQTVGVAGVGRGSDAGTDMAWTKGGLEGGIVGLDLVGVHCVEGGSVEVVVGGVGSGQKVEG